MGVGVGEGSDRALQAAREAIESPLLENVSIDGAKGMIVNFVADKRMALSEIREAMLFIKSKVSPEAKIKVGQAYDETMGDRLQVTVIATGFPARKNRALARGSLRSLGQGLRARTALDRELGLDEGFGSQRPGDHRPAAPVDDWTKPAFLHWKVRRIK